MAHKNPCWYLKGRDPRSARLRAKTLAISHQICSEVGKVKGLLIAELYKALMLMLTLKPLALCKLRTEETTFRKPSPHASDWKGSLPGARPAFGGSHHLATLSFAPQPVRCDQNSPSYSTPMDGTGRTSLPKQDFLGQLIDTNMLGSWLSLVARTRVALVTIKPGPLYLGNESGAPSMLQKQLLWERLRS